MVIVNDPIIQRQRYWTSSSSTFRSRMIYTLLLYLFPVILRIMIKKKLKKPITHMSSEFLYKVPFWLRWKWQVELATFNLSPNVFKGFWRRKNQKSARATENEVFLLFGLFGFFFFSTFSAFFTILDEKQKKPKQRKPRLTMACARKLSQHFKRNIKKRSKSFPFQNTIRLFLITSKRLGSLFYA